MSARATRIPGLLTAALIASIMTLGSSAASADRIDEILSKSKVELELKRGVARGRIIGSDGVQLKLQVSGTSENNAIEVNIDIDQVETPPEGFLKEARELVEEGFYHRAAVKFGIARVIGAKAPDMEELEARILEGLPAERGEIEDFRKQRLEANRQAFREEAMAKLKEEHPKIHQTLVADNMFMPRLNRRTPPELARWQSATLKNDPEWEEFADFRSMPPERYGRALSRARALVLKTPEFEEAAGNARYDFKRLDALMNLYMRTASLMWIEHLDMLRYASNLKELKSQKSAQEVLVERARKALREKLVPTTKIERSMKGNVLVEEEVPIEPNPDLVQRMRPRIESEIVSQREMSAGVEFLTAHGDSVFVPVDNWDELRRAQKLPDTPQEGYKSFNRNQYDRMKEGLDTMAMVWAEDPNDSDPTLALRLIEEELRALYSVQGDPPDAPEIQTASEKAEEEESPFFLPDIDSEDDLTSPF